MLGGVVFLAVFVLASGLASALVLGLWGLLGPTLGLTSAMRRARFLFALRVLPTAAALAVTALAVLAWLACEPGRADEQPGVVLLALAGAALVTIGAGLRRGVRTLRATQSVIAEWTAGAEPLSLPEGPAPAFRIRHAFPAVCLAGIRSPRLFVAEQVLDALTAPELAAVVAHEAGHLAARDNLKGLLIAFSMDMLTSSGRRLEREWHSASESAADDAATSDAAPPRGLALASALVKVAGLAPSSARLGQPVPALHDGEELAGRVRRLLRPPALSGAAAPARSRLARAVAGTALLGLASPLLPAGLRAVHSGLEILVRSLP